MPYCLYANKRVGQFMGNRKVWRLCGALAVILLGLCFSPLVLSEGKVEPILFGLPIVLSAGFGVSIALIILVIFGARFHPDRNWSPESGGN